ncbi:MAG: LPS assembly lipoprotein LptE [Pseudomonadota bacterium]
MTTMRVLAAHATFVLLLLLAGCGFHLRGTALLPFDSIHVAGAENSSFVAELKRALEGSSNARIVNDPTEAQAVLHIASEARDKRILSLSGGGKVREFQLYYHVAFHLDDGKGHDYIPGGEISIKRDFSYDDAQILAKESEEALLYRDMQADAVQQMLHRIAAARLSHEN